MSESPQHLSLTSLRFLQGLLNQQSIAVNSPEFLIGAQNAARAKDELVAAIAVAEQRQDVASVAAAMPDDGPDVPATEDAATLLEDCKADPAAPEASV